MAKTEQKSDQQEVAAKPEDRLYTVNCFVPVKVNGHEYMGHVKCDRGLAETLTEILSKKRHSDMMVGLGREFEYQRMLDGTKIVVDSQTKSRI